MGIDAQSAAPAIAASQAQQGGAGGAQQGGQQALLARLMPLIQQRMQQQAQGQGHRANFGPIMRADGGTAENGWTSQTGGGTQPPQYGMGRPTPLPVGLERPAEPGGEAEMSTPQQPAWQQLAARGIAGQGSAEANKAKLAEMNGAGGSMPSGGGDPMQALRQKIMDVAGAGAMRRDARPGGGMPRGVRAGIPSPGSAPPTPGEAQPVDMVGRIPVEQPPNPPGGGVRGGAGGNIRSRGGVQRGRRVNY